jgi:hypothetical protein
MKFLLVDNDIALEFLDRKGNKEHFVHAKHWVTSKTMRKYIQNLVVLVERKLAADLLSKFGVYFDGWTNKKMHYLGVVATYIKDGRLFQRLLSMAPMFDVDDDEINDDNNDIDDDSDDNGSLCLDTYGTPIEIDPREGDDSDEIKYGLSSSFNAVTIYGNIDHVLREYYQKSFDNVTHLGGDNASVCIRVCEIAGKPYDPCGSHLQNLEANRFVKKQDFISDAKDVVHPLMKEGMKSKVHAELSRISDVGTLL